MVTANDFLEPLHYSKNSRVPGSATPTREGLIHYITASCRHANVEFGKRCLLGLADVDRLDVRTAQIKTDIIVDLHDQAKHRGRRSRVPHLLILHLDADIIHIQHNSYTR